MTQAYNKLCDRARMCYDSPASLWGRDIENQTDGILARLKRYKHGRGYSRELVHRILEEQRQVKPGPDITSPELKRDFAKLGREIGKFLR